MSPDSPSPEDALLGERKLALERERFEFEKARFVTESKRRQLEEEKLEHDLRVLRRSSFLQPGYLAFAVTLIAALGGIYVAWRSDYYRMVKEEEAQARGDLVRTKEELAKQSDELQSKTTQLNTLKDQIIKANVQIVEQSAALASLQNQATKVKLDLDNAKNAYARADEWLYGVGKSTLFSLRKVTNQAVQTSDANALVDIVRASQAMSERGRSELLGEVAALAYESKSQIVSLLAAASLCATPEREKFHAYVVNLLTNVNTPVPNDVLTHRMIGIVVTMADFNKDERERFQSVLMKKGLIPAPR